MNGRHNSNLSQIILKSLSNHLTQGEMLR